VRPLADYRSVPKTNRRPACIVFPDPIDTMVTIM